MIKEIGKEKFEGRIKTIKIQGYYIVVIGLIIMILLFSLLLISCIYSLIQINEESIEWGMRNIVSLITCTGVSILFISLFIGLLKFSFKKIIVCEDYFVINNKRIYYYDIKKIEVVMYEIQRRIRYTRYYTYRKLNLLRITLKNTESFLDYRLGQYSIKDIRKLVEYIEEKSNCETTNVYDILDKVQKDIRKAYIIIFSIIAMILFILGGIPYIQSYIKEAKKPDIIERNIYDNSLYDNLDIRCRSIYGTTIDGEQGIIVITELKPGEVNVGDYIDIQAKEGGVYNLKIEKIEKYKYYFETEEYLRLYFKGIDSSDVKWVLKKPIKIK